MICRSLKSFVGKISMKKGQEKDIPPELARDLLQAKLVEKVVKERKKNDN